MSGASTAAGTRFDPCPGECEGSTPPRLRPGGLHGSLRSLRNARIPVVAERNDQRLRQHDRRGQGPKAVHLGVAHHEVEARVAGERACHGVGDGEHGNLADVGVGDDVHHRLRVLGEAHGDEQIVDADGRHLLGQHAADRVKQVAPVLEPDQSVRQIGGDRKAPTLTDDVDRLRTVHHADRFAQRVAVDVRLDCSTSEPDSSERIRTDLAERGASLVDAPLARTPTDAEAGRLNTMVGASQEDFERVRPLLEACCENIFHMGPVGSGHKTKLVYNFITMGYAALISEALCACAATGVDLKRFSDVVSAGGANSGIFQLIVPKALESGDCSGLNFSLANAAKDLRYYNRMADTVPLSGPLGRAVQHALIQGLNLGYANGLVGDLLRVQERLNGIGILDREASGPAPAVGDAATA